MYKEVQGYFADGVSTILTHEDVMLTIQLKVPNDGMPWLWMRLTYSHDPLC